MSEFLALIEWFAWAGIVIASAATGFMTAMILIELGIIRVEERGE